MSIVTAAGLTAFLVPAIYANASEADTHVATADAARTYSFDFATDAQGFTGDFADYSPDSADMRLKKGIEPLPAGTADGNGFLLEGANRSDDLYMFLKRRLGPEDGIVAGQKYSVRSAVTFWSKDSAKCGGVGGSPGASVFVKAGASTTEPIVRLDSNNHYRVSIDIGRQSQGGTEAAVIGNIDNGLACNSGKFVQITRTSSEALTVQADDGGNLWLNAGTDSGFEGFTQLYYSNVTATLTAL